MWPHSTAIWIHDRCLDAAMSTPEPNDGNSGVNPTKTKAPISDAGQVPDSPLNTTLRV
jgi:hypothetical protein